MKLFVVARDPHETAIRRSLNFGHTLGHALETATADSTNDLSHGEAIAIGMAQTTKYAVAQKKIGKDALERVKEILIRAELPYEIPKGVVKDKLIHLMTSDKKRSGETIKLVIPQTKLGQVDFEAPLPLSELAKLV